MINFIEKSEYDSIDENILSRFDNKSFIKISNKANSPILLAISLLYFKIIIYSIDEFNKTSID